MIKKIDFLSQPKKNHLKFKILMALFSTILVLAVGIYCLVKIDAFFDRFTLELRLPIEVKIVKPIEVVERKTQIKYIREFIKSLPKPETQLEEYICQKFGSDCQLALAIAKAESGMREEAIHINSDGSIDMGIFQINSVHWRKDGCNPKSLLDAYKNVDCAYKIYQASGWNAWSVYKFIKK